MAFFPQHPEKFSCVLGPFFGKAQQFSENK